MQHGNMPCNTIPSPKQARPTPALVVCEHNYKLYSEWSACALQTNKYTLFNPFLSLITRRSLSNSHISSQLRVYTGIMGVNLIISSSCRGRQDEGYFAVMDIFLSWLILLRIIIVIWTSSRSAEIVLLS